MTSVQFITSSSTSVNFGLYSSFDYNNNVNPDYIIPTYINGDGTGNGAGDPALNQLIYGATGLNPAFGGSGTSPSVIATVSQMGSVWGVAYNKNTKKLYVASMLKRHVGFAQGPGYIHVIDYSSGSGVYQGAFDLQAVIPSNSGISINLGTVCRDASCGALASDYLLPSDKGSPSVDLDAFGKVGKISYGDIDIEPGTNNLWAINLNQRALIKINTTGNPVNSPPATANIQQYILANISGYPTSSTGVLRPWGIGFNNGKGYIGVTNDATSGGASDLLCYVLEFDPNNITAGFTTVLSFNPNFNRSAFLGDFRPWMDIWNNSLISFTSGTSVCHYSEPILSDINFDENNNMYLSISDRFGHQTGALNHFALSGDNNFTSCEAQGDLRKACWDGSSYSIDGNSACGGAGEFFNDMSGNGTNENAEGAAALLKGRREIIEISIDPNPNSTGALYYDSQGTMTYSLDNGEPVNYYTIYKNATTAYFDKANGIGDIELLTTNPPLEIGNRVWNDTNSNGIQDAGESGISGVSVQLYNSAGTTLIASATTDANGNYIFSNATGTSTTAFRYNLSTLVPNTAYIVRVPTSTGGLSLTSANSGSNNSIDSDAPSTGDVPVLATEIPMAGANNHTFDIGYSPAACTLTDAGKTNEACNDAGTTSNPADDYITFSLNPTGSNLGTGYTVTVSGGATISPTSGTYGSATNFQLQSGSANGTVYTITITDNSSGSCQITTTLQQNECSYCPTPDCLEFQVIKNNN